MTPAVRSHRTSLVHAKKKQLGDVKSDINVTPLVDVCLVLLIIFMVVAPMLSRGKPVDLPEAVHATKKNDIGTQPIVSVLRDQGGAVRVYYDRDEMPTKEALIARVQEELAKMKDPMPVFVKADADLLYGDVYPTLMAIHEAQAPGVELGTALPKGMKEP